MALRITDRERNAILNSLSAGVVPRIGIQHIAVGRKDEIAALLNNLQQMENNVAFVRFIVGRFGTGKSFLLNLFRTVALEKKFIVARADITTQRRLYASDGKARALYSELMTNLCTRGKPDGGALANIIERWVGDVVFSIKNNDGDQQAIEAKFHDLCAPLNDLVSGYDFVTVLTQYYRGYLQQNDELQANAIRWLRAEYTTKTDARKDLGVRTIINDDSFYDYLKLFAKFVQIAGYSGLVVCLDELVVLSHRLNNRAARNNNYEAILRIVNDCLQGSVEGLGFIFAATDECLVDTRRGLYSYEALATRLRGNRYATDDRPDMNSPVIHLRNLTPEDCFVLLQRIRHVHAGGDETQYLVPDKAIEAYLNSCQQRMGAAYFQTPRDTIKDWVNLLNMLQQNPSEKWETLIGEIKTEAPEQIDPSVAAAATSPDDDLESFTL